MQFQAYFNLVLKLALEYKIKNIRVQYEKPYFVPKFNKILTMRYPINLIKLELLNTLSITNKNTVLKIKLKFQKKININDYLIGVNFTGNMDRDTILAGLSSLQNIENKTVEILVHPKYLTCDEYKLNYKELLAVTEPELKNRNSKTWL